MTKKKHFENCGRTDGRTTDATPWHKLIGPFGPDELKTEEVVCDARFSPHFCHNMPLPWQHSFCHCRKMCLAHLHPKVHICAKFHENWSKTEEVVRDARLATDRPTDRQPDRPPDDTLIPIYPLIHYVYAGVYAGVKKAVTFLFFARFGLNFNWVSYIITTLRWK